MKFILFQRFRLRLLVYSIMEENKRNAEED